MTKTTYYQIYIKDTKYDENVISYAGVTAHGLKALLKLMIGTTKVEAASFMKELASSKRAVLEGRKDSKYHYEITALKVESI